MARPHTLIPYRRRPGGQDDRLIGRTMDTTRRLRLFLCHSKQDKARVQELYSSLVRDGFDPWLDERELKPGHDWEFEIERAIEDCDVFIVCLSTRAIDSRGYLHKELKRAYDQAFLQPE